MTDTEHKGRELLARAMRTLDDAIAARLQWHRESGADVTTLSHMANSVVDTATELFLEEDSLGIFLLAAEVRLAHAREARNA